jgi:integrase
LAEAREGRDLARKQLRGDIDPSEAKKKARQGQGAGTTFRQAAKEYLAKLEREQRALATRTKAEWVLGLVEDALGSRSLSEIAPLDVLQAIRPVEQRGRHETARRLKSTIGAVFRFALANGQAASDPTQPLKGALTRPTQTPRAAVTDSKALAPLLRAIDGYEGQPVIAAALKLLPLLFTRPGELRGAKWEEFDLEAAIWIIPAERTKVRRAHRVPLSRQALDIIHALRALGLNSVYLFPSVRTLAKPISENTLNAALRALGYDKDTVTAHGFRATASTLLNEANHWHPDVIERQLGHADANTIRRAYARSEYWNERVRMMQWWADHLDGIKATKRLVVVL